MVRIKVPYGKGCQVAELPEEKLAGVFESGVNECHPSLSGGELIEAALNSPSASPRLEELAAKARNAVIIASDHTRPVPSKLIMPPLLKRLRLGNPSIDISILIATGCHRETTRAELVGKFGEDIVASERIVIHDCRNEVEMASLGKLPSGAELKINKLAVECDLLLSEGFIEPHFFAGFSGGRKSVLPGIASEITVLGNHCAKFIADPNARAGVLDGNPLHKDMLHAARAANLKFILNVVINAERKVIGAFAGDVDSAHRTGCSFIKGLCGIKVPESDIVISGNGGYPLDQNIYQAVKGMSAAEAVCRPGGVIIMVSECADGHGGESFHRMLAESANPAELLSELAKTPQDETLPDQWEAQILARILSRFKVIMVSGEDAADIVKSMHMLYTPSLEDALKMAFEIAGSKAKVAAIPDGVAVIAEKKSL
jgi:lactate racemase